MRNAFIERLVAIAEEDPRVHLITADLGFTVVERFAKRFPDRYLNVGVAEQNMLGIATGLAQLGFVPFCYSIATFASLRGYEQLRNGPILHGLPVRVVGIGGGYAYGHASFTHFALEDLAVMRLQPGMTVLAPADPAQTQAALAATRDLPGPVYFRVGKGGNPAVPGLDGRFALGRPELIREGRDLLLLATGDIVFEALRASDALFAHGVSAAVAVVAHLSFSPSKALVELVGRFHRVLSVEEGYAPSGLGGLVAEAIATSGSGAALSIAGVAEPFRGRSGSVAYMRGQAGIDADGIVRRAMDLLRKRE
jgi:transketolase